MEENTGQFYKGRIIKLRAVDMRFDWKISKIPSTYRLRNNEVSKIKRSEIARNVLIYKKTARIPHNEEHKKRYIQ